MACVGPTVDQSQGNWCWEAAIHALTRTASSGEATQINAQFTSEEVVIREVCRLRRL